MMANALEVGLGALVWSPDEDKAREVAARIQAGRVWINKRGAGRAAGTVRRRQAVRLRPRIRRRRPQATGALSGILGMILQ